MKSRLTDFLKKLKPEGMPQWLWGLILLGVILGVAFLVQQLAGPPSREPEAESPLGGASFVFDLILAFLFLMGVLFIGLYVVRRWQRGGSASGAHRLQILESKHLSPKQAVHLIRAGQRLFMVGATDQGISLISEIENEPASAEDASPVSFAKELERSTSQQGEVLNGLDEIVEGEERPAHETE